MNWKISVDFRIGKKKMWKPWKSPFSVHHSLKGHYTYRIMRERLVALSITSKKPESEVGSNEIYRSQKQDKSISRQLFHIHPDFHVHRPRLKWNRKKTNRVSLLRASEFALFQGEWIKWKENSARLLDWLMIYTCSVKLQKNWLLFLINFSRGI